MLDKILPYLPSLGISIAVMVVVVTGLIATGSPACMAGLFALYWAYQTAPDLYEDEPHECTDPH